MNPKRILIIDDEAGFTKLVKLNLERTGEYIVQEENDAEKAVATAREFMPDLILLDIVMPKVDGGDIAFKIKEDYAFKKTHIIFLTALVTDKEASSSNLMGGFPFLAKPIGLDKLIECLEKYLNPKPPGFGI